MTELPSQADNKTGPNQKNERSPPEREQLNNRDETAAAGSDQVHAKPYCGLKNLPDQVDYLNAIVQLLYHNDIFRDYVRQHLRKLFYQMDAMASTSADDVHSTLLKLQPQFHKNEPKYEAQQLFVALVGVMQREANQVNKQRGNEQSVTPLESGNKSASQAWDNYCESVNKSDLATLMTAQMETSLACLTCGHQSPSWSVSCPVQVNFPEKVTSIYRSTLKSFLENQSAKQLFLGICTWRTLSITILVIGVVIFFAAILGLCAIMCQSPAVLNAYVYLIALGCCIVMAGNFCFWYYSETLTDKASNYYHQLVVNSSSDTDAMDVVQKVQLWAYCCGEKTFMDWHNQTLINRSIDSRVGLGQFPESCCGKSSSSMSYATNLTLGYCDGSDVSYYDGCFSSAQVSRYQVFGQSLIVLALFFKLLLLVLSCCLDQDRQLDASKLVNLQYAAHLHVCRSQGGVAASAQHYNSMGLSRPRDSWRV